MVFALHLSDLFNDPRGVSVWLYWCLYRRGSALAARCFIFIYLFFIYDVFERSSLSAHGTASCQHFHLSGEPKTQKNKLGWKRHSEVLHGPLWYQRYILNVYFIAWRESTSKQQMLCVVLTCRCTPDARSFLFFLFSVWFSLRAHLCGRSKTSARLSKRHSCVIWATHLNHPCQSKSLKWKL